MPAQLRATLAKHGTSFQELWCSPDYEVFVRYLDEPDRERDGALHLSIKRYDREPVWDWRHKQAIKNEIAGPLREGVELFPNERRLVDSANQTHLWVMPDDVQLELGFTTYAAFDMDQAREMAVQQGHDPADLDKGRQRPWEPGISTGPAYAESLGWTVTVPES